MSIDFSKKEQREGYLQNKLDDLLDGINASYGQSLLDELMIRLEATIDDFNKEVDDLMDGLKKSSDEKEKLLQQIKSGEVDSTQDVKPAVITTMKLLEKKPTLVSGKKD